MEKRLSVRCRAVLAIVCVTVWSCRPTAAAETLVPPDKFLGHAVGADYELANWEKITQYVRHVGEASDRVNVRELGQTTEGRPLVLVEIASADAIGELDKHRRNQRKIADPRLIADEAEERQLVENSKIVVLINCNLHSTEVASSQMAMELLYDLATGNSPQIQEILERAIILLIPSANPDGLDKVIAWYERSRGQPWEGTGMPWLYQTYAGHDNNRDWFMLALKETRLVTQMLYREWFPTILYDIHQMGNKSVRFFVPPFHDPKNANVHPLIDQSLLIIGGHMASELGREGKKGVIHGAMYDNWWAGGFRTTPYRHNIVGVLTEAASPLVATPIFQRKSELEGVRRGLPEYTMTTNFPDPWPGGWWRLRDVVDYEKIACMSLFTLAARYREMFQDNYIRIGREAIERSKTEPPFAWLVPPDQRDPHTAAQMLEILHTGGVEVCQAEASFVADGAEYPAGTFVMYCAQPYRAHLNDMMERQVYPDRKRWPGGPAEAPYDIAGWTLPLQMGVRHVAVARPFECKARSLSEIPMPRAQVRGPEDAKHYIVLAGTNDDFCLANRLHKAGIPFDIYASEQDWRLGDGTKVPAGSLVIHDAVRFRGNMQSLTEGLANQIVGLSRIDRSTTEGVLSAPPPRLGLYQPWTANIDEGWTRLVLENFEFPYTSVHNAEIRAGRLRQRYDCLVLPSLSTSSILTGQPSDTTAPEYVGGIGKEGIVSLQEFIREGGTMVCIDQSCDFAIEHFNIPVRNIVKETSSKEFYCPGSVLRVSVDPNHPVGWGMPEWISAYFSRSQAFELKKPSSKEKDPRHPAARFPASVVARYSDTVLLESGWILGKKVIADKPAVVEVEYGAGRIVLFGFRVQHRAQPHGTFRLLFNAIQRSTLKESERSAKDRTPSS